MSSVRKIAKNTGMLFVSQIVSYILGFFYIIFIARYLGAEGFGNLSFAIAFTGIFGILMDLGFITLIMREVAKDKLLASKYLGNIIVIKMILVSITFGLIILTSKIMGYPQQTINLIYLLAFSVIFTSFIGIFNSIFQAYEKMVYPSISMVLNSILMFIGVLLVINYKFDVLGFALIYIVTNLLIFVYSLIICLWKFFLPKLEVDLNFWKFTIKEAIFFGVANVFSTIYFSIGLVMLSMFVGSNAVGYYNAVYRLIFILLFIPSVFIISFFPVMSRQFKFSKDKLKIGYEKSFKYLLVIAIFIFIFGLIFADKIVLIIYGNGYVSSIKAFQVLIWVIPIIFITYLLTNILYVINKQRIVTIITGLVLIVNISLNIFLIPQFSYIGAAMATVLTEGFGFIIIFYYTSKYFFRISVKQNIMKPIAGGLIIIIFIYILKVYVNWMFAAILGIFSFVLVFYLLNIITNEDIKLFKQIFK